MADEANERRMDLNLYLGLPRSPRRPRSSEDLGSDLALGSMPMSSSPSIVQESLVEVEPLPDSPPQIDEHFTPPSVMTDNENLDDYSFYDVSTEVINVDSPYTPPNTAALPTMHEADELSPTPLSYPSASQTPVTPNPSLDRQSPPPQPSRELLQYPEFRFRRLIESSDRLLVRRLHSSIVPYGGERLRSAAAGSLCSAEQLLHDIVSTPRSVRNNGKEKVSADDSLVEDPGEKAEKRKSMADFDCNICLYVAKEPVVTSCGHLFCWSCLYQWLHIHSGHKECPVCKGEVVDTNITPIYGRGSAGAIEEKPDKDGDMSRLKIPPRPRGQRHESFRQQLQRPLLRRFGEGVSWRRIFDEEMPGQIGIDGDRESGLRELIESHQRAFARIREWRNGRENGNTEGGPSRHNNTSLFRVSTASPHIAATSSPVEDNDIWERLSLRGFGLSERLAAISADLGRVVERLGGSTERLNRNRNANTAIASPSSANPQNLEPESSRVATVSAQASDQASAASSTIAVIEGGDVSATLPPVEPSTAGPSRTSRTSGRSRGSSSLDCDGSLHERKRRRSD